LNDSGIEEELPVRSLDNLFLDGPFRYEPKDLNRFLLTDPVYEAWEGKRKNADRR
jgi:hypothetical protein